MLITTWRLAIAAVTSSVITIGLSITTMTSMVSARSTSKRYAVICGKTTGSRS